MRSKKHEIKVLKLSINFVEIYGNFSFILLKLSFFYILRNRWFSNGILIEIPLV